MLNFHRSQKFRDEGWRCGTRAPAATPQAAPADCSLNSTMIQGEYDPGGVLEIPVVFHIAMSQGGSGAVPDALIQSQVAILNEDFSALVNTPGAEGTFGGIHFTLATVDPNGQPSTGITRHMDDGWFGGDDVSMSNAVGWDTNRYLNIYTMEGGAALGWATLPQQSAGDSGDGVVLAWATVGRNAPMGGDFDQGRTGTHEVGHYLGLLHTFDGGCGNAGAPYSSGDLIADTTAEATETYDCVVAPSGCGVGNAPIRNYMNYTPDTCMTRFSPEQVNRMRCSIINYRPGLTNRLPGANFTFAIRTLAVDFTDASSNGDGTITRMTACTPSR